VHAKRCQRDKAPGKGRLVDLTGLDVVPRECRHADVAGRTIPLRQRLRLPPCRISLRDQGPCLRRLCPPFGRLIAEARRAARELQSLNVAESRSLGSRLDAMTLQVPSSRIFDDPCVQAPLAAFVDLVHRLRKEPQVPV
jgi:hypothetical protein